MFCSILSHVEVLNCVSCGTVTKLLNACVCEYNWDLLAMCSRLSLHMNQNQKRLLRYTRVQIASYLLTFFALSFTMFILAYFMFSLS